jgi:hypothetical protein
MALDNNVVYVPQKNVLLFQSQSYELTHNKALIDDEVHYHQ